jgi:hypothetical protein
MSHLNLEGHNPVESEEYEGYPRYKFLESLRKSELFWSDDWECWYLLTDNWIDPANGMERMVGAVVVLDVGHISGVSDKSLNENTVHIRSIAVADDVKGVGLLGLICSTLIRAAEDNGVFLWGVARSFECRIPSLFCMDDIQAWRESGEYSRSFSYGASWNRAKENTKRLMRAYLSHGFRRFDLDGHRFQNKFFKDFGFGYCGSGLSDTGLISCLNKRVSC